uniref:Uncharacterized protein n=1 Tax=Plectus sambesii TaxID=2011161 RepID=A0A914UP09_9BILA
MFVVSYVLIAYFSVRVYLKVKSHFDGRRRRTNRRQSDYTQDVTDKDVVKATLYQAVVPLIAQLPQFVSAVHALFETRVPPPIDYWGYIVALFMVVGPLADVLLTFSAIRAYRSVIEQIFNRVQLLFKSATVSPGSSM